MLSNGGQADQPAGVSAAVGGLEAAVTALQECDPDVLTTSERLAFIAALARASRRLASVEAAVIAGVQREATPVELGEGLAGTLARVLQVSKGEANHRIRDAEVVAPRIGMTGEPLPPTYTATATTLAAGNIDRAHVREIRRFFHLLPAAIDAAERDKAEQFLASTAVGLRPDELRKAADHLLVVMGREDDYCDSDRARRRGFTWCHQDADGMSKGTLYATPALRAQLDAVFAAWAAPGKCNPDDESPCTDGDPEPDVAERDRRNPAQRRHDALTAISRAMLASGELGSHNGLPVTVIVSTTLQELQSGTGKARTGGGTILPMADVIRMATHANHYLAIFDGAKEIPLWLGRTRRTASPGQRIVLHAHDRGCTFPGCDLPGYLCQAHHVEDWDPHGLTNIDNLTFACPAHHRLVTPGGWATRKDAFGRTEWIPPPQLEIPGGINNTHHPERYLE